MSKLFLVTLKGMQSNPTGTPWGIAYVVSADTNGAYNAHKRLVDQMDVGFRHERELESIELLAESSRYPECRRLLIIP